MAGGVRGLQGGAGGRAVDRVAAGRVEQAHRSCSTLLPVERASVPRTKWRRHHPLADGRPAAPPVPRPADRPARPGRLPRGPGRPGRSGPARHARRPLRRAAGPTVRPATAGGRDEPHDSLHRRLARGRAAGRLGRLRCRVLGSGTGGRHRLIRPGCPMRKYERSSSRSARAGARTSRRPSCSRLSSRRRSRASSEGPLYPCHSVSGTPRRHAGVLVRTFGGLSPTPLSSVAARLTLVTGAAHRRP